MKSKVRWCHTNAALITVGALLSLIAGMFAEASPALASPPWTTSQLVPPAGASQNIAAVSTSSTTEAVFWVPQNGSVQERYFYKGIGWFNYQVAPAGSADQFSDIVAVSRVRNSVADTIDVFWVGPNRSIEHAFYQDGLPWLREPQVAPGGGAGPSASLAVVSRAANTWELFWVGPDSAIEDAYWYEGGPSGRFQLASPGSSTPKSAPRQITAVSRASNTMEVWWIGKDGSVQDRYFYDMVGWNGFTLAPSGSAYVGIPAGAITAVSRASNTMEVWWIGRDNSVQDAYWYVGQPWARFTLSGANSAENAISSVAPSAGAMNVTWTGWGANSVQNASFGPPWSQIQLAPGGPFTDGGIASVSRATGSVDVFWVTFNGAIEQASQ
jgi:hypothetical protein